MAESHSDESALWRRLALFWRLPQRHEAFPDRENGQLRARASRGLLQCPGHVGLDRSGRQVETLADFNVGESLGEQLNDLELFDRQTPGGVPFRHSVIRSTSQAFGRRLMLAVDHLVDAGDITAEPANGRGEKECGNEVAAGVGDDRVGVMKRFKLGPWQ